jgi:hypothetical protein
MSLWERNVRWIAAAVMTKHHLLAMTLAEGDGSYHKESRNDASRKRILTIRKAV